MSPFKPAPSGHFEGGLCVALRHTKVGIIQASCLHPWTKLFFLDHKPSCLLVHLFTHSFLHSCILQIFMQLRLFPKFCARHLVWSEQDQLRSSLLSRSTLSRRRRRTCQQTRIIKCLGKMVECSRGHSTGAANSNQGKGWGRFYR